MELWIRSQDKYRLVKVEQVDITTISGRYNIVGNGGLWRLGRYGRKERCLEILDELQKLLFSPTQIVIGDDDVDEAEYDRLCKQLKTNGIACLPNDSRVQYLDKDWVLYEMPEK